MMIKGISTIYRPQRSGKVHLGVKVTKRKDGSACAPFPTEVDYFVLTDAPWLIPIYGDKPTELHVTLPSARFERENFSAYLEKVFPQYLKRYKKSGLMCKGDGETANVVTEKGLEEIVCPCDYLDKGECKRMGSLRLRIQEVPTFNVVQIDTSSFNSIVNMNSFIRDLVEFCIVNRIDVSDVKLVLRRQETVTQRLEGTESKTSKHHVLVLDLDPRFYKTLDEVRTKALPQSKAPAPLALPEPTDPDTEEFYPDAEAEEAKAEDEAPPPAPVKQPEKPPKKPADRLKAAVDDFKRLGGIVSPAELKRISAIKSDEAFDGAAKYFEGRAADLKRQKGLPF